MVQGGFLRRRERVNIIRIALIAPQEKDRQQLREQMFSYAVRWKVAVVTDCFDCLEEFAMAAQSGGYQLVCLRGGERQWRAAEELRRIRGEGETLWAYLEEGQALRAKVLTAADTFGAVEWRRVSGMNTVMTDYFALAPRHARDAILPIKHPLRTDDIHYIQAQKQTLHLVGDDLPADEGLHTVLHEAAQGTGAEGRVVGAVDDVLLGRRGEGHLELLILQAAVELGHQQIDDVGDVVLGEGLVEHNLVQPVEELGPEGVVQQIVDGIFRLGGDVALLIDAVQQVLGLDCR